MTAQTVRRFRITTSWVVYGLSLALGFPFGVSLAYLVFRFSFPAAIAASLLAVLFGEVALGQWVFTSVEIKPDWVRLVSPFKRLEIAKLDVANVRLWLSPSAPERTSFWKQAAVLFVTLRNGRNIAISMLDVTILRAIASQIQ